MVGPLLQRVLNSVGTCGRPTAAAGVELSVNTVHSS